MSPEPKEIFNSIYNDKTFGQNKVLIKFDDLRLGQKIKVQ